MSRAFGFSLLPTLALGLTAAVQGAMLLQGWPGVLQGLFFVAAWLFAAVAFEPLWRRAQPGGTEPTGWGNRAAFWGLVLAQGSLGIWIVRHALGGLLAPPLASGLAADPRVHLAGVGLLFALFFLRQWLGDEETRRDAAPALHLLIGALAVQSVIGLLAPLFPNALLAAWSARALALIALILPIEWALALALRFFLSPRRRRAAPFLGRSLVLAALLGGRSPFATFGAALRDAVGLELRGTWVARALRLCGEPLLLVLLLALWLSSAVVVVPLGHEGVLLRWGRFQPEPLGAGLHLVAPWPAERVRLVPVGRVDGFALGFTTDLGGALLWTEKHFEGEKNLLVGNGEEALNFNVPVQFSRRYALDAERVGPVLPSLLAQLAQRELLRATAPRDSFGIMTSEREAIANEVERGLQRAADHLSLGARIHHVGLKDIHPPVEVASAYQEVISAAEQRRMMIDLAIANRITRLAETRSEARRLRGGAEGAAAVRLAKVTGEAARLTGKVEARLASPELFDWQSRLALTEEIVPRTRLFITRSDSSGASPLNLDYREPGAGLP